MSLNHTQGRVVIKVDMQFKNSHQFENGTVIRLERGPNNLNRRETMPVNAIVISSENIPVDSEILCHHNSLTDENRLFNYKPLSGYNIVDDIKYFSIPELEAFLWRVPGEEWQPIKGFTTALRVFKPYTGLMQGIPPTKLKDTLYITSGKLSGQVIMTVRAADYQIVFQDNGKERNVIRLRHDDEVDIEREEIILIHHNFTEMVQNGELLLGITISDAKPVNEIKYV